MTEEVVAKAERGRRDRLPRNRQRERVLQAVRANGAAIDAVELAFVRTLPHVRQVEVIFRASMSAARLGGLAKSFEIDRAEWFARDALPEGLSRDQRRLIEGGGRYALDVHCCGAGGGANTRPPT